MWHVLTEAVSWATKTLSNTKFYISEKLSIVSIKALKIINRTLLETTVYDSFFLSEESIAVMCPYGLIFNLYCNNCDSATLT